MLDDIGQAGFQSELIWQTFAETPKKFSSYFRHASVSISSTTVVFFAVVFDPTSVC
jgi:hypothetical protein